MTLETKYNPGQEVWVMRDNKPFNFFIHSINIVISKEDGSILQDDDKQITYKILYNLTSGVYFGRFKEDDIYATKEDLKDKLFG